MLQTMVHTTTLPNIGYQTWATKPNIGYQTKHRLPNMGCQTQATKHRLPNMCCQTQATKHGCQTQATKHRLTNMGYQSSHLAEPWATTVHTMPNMDYQNTQSPTCPTSTFQMLWQHLKCESGTYHGPKTAQFEQQTHTTIPKHY